MPPYDMSRFPSVLSPEDVQASARRVWGEKEGWERQVVVEEGVKWFEKQGVATAREDALPLVIILNSLSCFFVFVTAVLWGV